MSRIIAYPEKIKDALARPHTYVGRTTNFKGVTGKYCHKGPGDHQAGSNTKSGKRPIQIL